MDLKNELFDFIGKYRVFSKEEQDLIFAQFKLVEMRKGDFFFQAGDHVSKIGFVFKGILRSFFFDEDGKEVTTLFIKKGQLTDIPNFVNEGKSAGHLQAATPVLLLVISKNDVYKLSKSIDGWDYTVGQIFSAVLSDTLSIKTKMLNQDAKTRYLHFIRDNPEIVNQVPLSQVATYLGMTQYSLSRIRKNIR